MSNNDDAVQNIEKCVRIIGEGVELLEARFGRHPILDSARRVLSGVLRSAHIGVDPILLAAICAGLMMELDDWQYAKGRQMDEELEKLRALCNVPPDRTMN